MPAHAFMHAPMHVQPAQGMLDRQDNIKFLVQGAQAYRQLAAQLAWEGTFEQNRNQPAPFSSSFGQQSVDLEYEAFASKTTLDDLQSKHYPGVGNDVQKWHHAIGNLEIWLLCVTRKTR